MMPSSPTSRLHLCLLAAVLLAPVVPAQQADAPQAVTPEASAQQPVPKGTVLFERHEAPATPEAPQGDETPAPSARQGVSSSTRQPRLRRRRAEASPAPGEGETVPEQTVPAAEENSSSSSSLGETAQPAAISVTAADVAAAAKVSPAERLAVLIVARQMEFHLNVHTGLAEVRAQLTVRNTGPDDLRVVPLRLSGALRWESARVAGGRGPLPLEQHHLRDDLDHTGVATELALLLPEPVRTGATASLDLFYGGTLGENTSRLLAMGAPVEAAVRTDWDTVTDTFTGFRGMGNVLWYPVSGEPALLRDGAAVTQAVPFARMREAESSLSVRLTLEYDGARPDAAFLCGERRSLTSAADGIATAEWQMDRLGLRTPSFFVASAAPQEMAGGLVRVVTDEADRAAALGESAARVGPFLEQWLGPRPSQVLDVIDLPIPGAAGFSDGSLLVAPLRTALPEAMAPSLVGPLASAWLPEGIVASWLHEGIPAFLQAVWAEQTGGRPAALAALAAESERLRRIGEADVPQVSSSSDDVPLAEIPQTPLATCSDPACDRGRAAYVLEMLRGMIGDTALQGALAGWRVAEEGKPESAAEETAHLETLLRQMAGNKTLDWFFRNWIDGGGSLPQLSIVAVAPRKIERGAAPANLLPEHQQPFAGPVGAEPVAPTDDPRAHWGGDKEVVQAGSWLVAVEVQNAGGTDAEVPVTVRAGTLSNTLPLRVPAHGKATIRVPFEAAPDEVLVNDGSVPEAGASIHRRAIQATAR